ncbi:esterase B1-like [Rhagoletis pomonella]|uniref:esterase B1-like n=1 Tax=Rhagoletis pomonella TaxID=28610 RepID=UPI001786A071|nr:esterase B1-like [Rhagoletis pomonella]
MATDSGILETVELQLPQGRIRGATRETVNGITYYSFEGIPYAQPPVGKLRFRTPKPFGNWKDTLDCTNSPPKPVQKNNQAGKADGSEDCLYLNVFTKNIDAVSKQMPVMVWIYGGGFQSGHAARDHHGPDYLLQEDIVFVSLNYRLDSLGFLSLSDPNLDVPGNAALKDQLLALKWIKKNIHYFGGNCNNITLLGESAGATCVHFLSLTEQSRDLFQRAILMSGSALCPWALMTRRDLAYQLAVRHGYKGENKDSDVLAYLENLDAGKLVEHSLVNDDESRYFLPLTFAPTVEPYESDNCIIPNEPFNMLRTAWSNSIPMLMGGTSFEGLLLYPHLKMSQHILDIVRQLPEILLPAEVRRAHNKIENRIMSERILKLYFGEQKDEVVLKQPNQDPLFDLMHLCSHRLFWHGLHRTALARMKYATANTFLYRFDFDSPTFNHHRLRFGGEDCVNGVAHADDLSYLFYLQESRKLAEESHEHVTIQRMVGIWTTFAKLGDPNGAHIEPHIWLPIEKKSADYGLNISHEVQVMQIPDAPKLAAWDALYDKRMLYGSVSDIEEDFEESTSTK